MSAYYLIRCPESGTSYPLQSNQGLRVLKKYVYTLVHPKRTFPLQTGGIFETFVEITVTWQKDSDLCQPSDITVAKYKKYFDSSITIPDPGVVDSSMISSKLNTTKSSDTVNSFVNGQGQMSHLHYDNRTRIILKKCSNQHSMVCYT